MNQEVYNQHMIYRSKKDKESKILSFINRDDATVESRVLSAVPNQREMLKYREQKRPPKTSNGRKKHYSLHFSNGKLSMH